MTEAVVAAIRTNYPAFVERVSAAVNVIASGHWK